MSVETELISTLSEDPETIIQRALEALAVLARGYTCPNEDCGHVSPGLYKKLHQQSETVRELLKETMLGAEVEAATWAGMHAYFSTYERVFPDAEVGLQLLGDLFSQVFVKKEVVRLNVSPMKLPASIIDG